MYLMDTMGDGKKYVPYWASRYEFNQVILSGRMLSDHSIPHLVDILRALNLDDVHEVKTWHVDNIDVEDENSEVRLIIPFSNPQGKIPLILIVFVLIACSFAMISNQGCNYVTRSSLIFPLDGRTPYPGIGMNTGLWSYNLKFCPAGEDCSLGDYDNLEDSAYCQPYAQMLETDINWKAARAFGSLSAIFGLFGLVLISTATCTHLKRQTWLLICSFYLLTTLFQGLQFLYFKSGLCTEWMYPDAAANAGDVAASDCTLSRYGKFRIIATVFWFLTAIGCSHMA